MSTISGADQRLQPSLTWKALDLIAVLMHHVAPWLLLAIALYLFRDIVIRLTTGETGVEIWVELVSNVSRTRAFAFVFGFFGIYYGLKQRNLRESAVSSLTTRIEELENRIRQNQEPVSKPV